MLGLIYLIKGNLEYSSYDFENEQKSLIIKKSEGSISKNQFLTLSPTLNNLHSVRANSDSLMLDVFMPNYSQSNPCTFYKIDGTNQVIPFYPDINFWQIPEDFL